MLLCSSIGETCDHAQSQSRSLLQQGQALVRQNCGDCIGSTKEKLLDGIELIQAALAHGLHEDEAKAYRALAEGYATMVYVFSEPDSADQEDFRKLQREAWRCYLEIEPRDVDALERYAYSLEHAEERVTVWRRILGTEPKHVQARASVGDYLVATGEVDEGLLLVRAAFDDAVGAEKRAIGGQLLELLLSVGKEEEAAELRGVIAHLPREE